MPSPVPGPVEAAALSGEPTEPTPEPSELLAALKVFGIEPPENPGEEWTLVSEPFGPEPVGGTAVEAAEEANLQWSHVEERMRWLEKELQRVTGSVRPAVPSAATRPEDDAQLQQTLENYAAVHGDTRQSWGGFEKERARAEAEHWAAISDWHRRTLGGEPA